MIAPRSIHVSTYVTPYQLHETDKFALVHDHTHTSIPQPTHDIERLLTLAENITSHGAEKDGYILDTGTFYRTIDGVRTALEVEKVTARHAPGPSLDTRFSFEPTFNAFAIPQIDLTQLGTSSTLPSYLDPSVLGLRASSDQQGPLQPELSSMYDYNANFDPEFAMGPQALSITREAGVQETTHTAPIPDTSSNLHTNFFGHQAMSWGQAQTSSEVSNFARPSHLSLHDSGAQYTTPPDNFGAGESFEYNLHPDSVYDLLESELGAVSMRPAGIVSKADLVSIRRGLNPPSEAL